MKFLIVNTDYPDFLSGLYAGHPGLQKETYDAQIRTRNESLFGIADFYSENLRKLGHEAWDVHANNEPMQRAWAKERGVRLSRGWSFRFRLKHRILPRLKVVRNRKWLHEILAAQIRHHRPDVLLNHDPAGIPCAFLRELKPHMRLLVGQHAAMPLAEDEDWTAYDLVVSSFPPTVDFFRKHGVRAELYRLGFEPEVLLCLEDGRRRHSVTFVGSLLGVHSSRIALLDKICARLPRTRIWGPGVDHLPPSSPIRKCYAGKAWGREMYQILRDSQIVMNHHGNVPPYANNMRLYEATGVGAMLITDWKENLHEMFEPGKEVAAYRSPEECVELIRYYLAHEDERQAIARAGQERTLREHTYYQRMQELVDIVSRYL
ncbi:MAG: CgeB family protein [Planctomycetota bacterium]|jgi:hypothetical protein